MAIIKTNSHSFHGTTHKFLGFFHLKLAGTTQHFVGPKARQKAKSQHPQKSCTQLLDSILSDLFCFRTRYEELIGGSADAPNSALFDLAEKVEHSCLPNCMYSSKSGKLKYCAIRPIQDCLRSTSYGPSRRASIFLFTR